MLLQQHFIIEGKYLGAVTRQFPLSALGYAFVCGGCAEVWARCPIDGVQQFQIFGFSCRKCPSNSLYIPGSVYVNWDKEFSESFPDEVVKWEFEVAMQLTEKEMK